MFELAPKDRVIKVFNYNPLNKELIGPSDAWVVAHTGLPAYCTLDTPPMKKKGKAIVYGKSGWEYVEDNRGANVYSTIDRGRSQVTDLGPLTDDKTLLAPSSEFDVWDGKKWVKNAEAEKNALFIQAQQDKKERMALATESISILAFAKESGQATDEELEALDRWQNYRLQLSRTDLSKGGDINWPDAV
ncbi:MAG: tail fiber assembly protein [Ewingella americana]|jgi:hypothetical protein|uniref:tail fiber assembly protein n=1 Tax=Ewingella americana TaxID=41202 RepID=UPI00242F4A76|nr:tail fiber assembly protein [Ewingella americana]MCI1680057.1 tail fiber assembly protein [Ewingella americana]MCI1855052.1 tail fiber assembly protein [Ewingella americana]MCI1863529.1 tail fiber assembly protein [Ewingella americana]MCI2143399.1 tail fiber assembly protein [Ewingella americana]MCI2164556.1 tail fiber assembly protein [Ewingella americana]